MPLRRSCAHIVRSLDDIADTRADVTAEKTDDIREDRSVKVRKSHVRRRSGIV